MRRIALAAALAALAAGTAAYVRSTTQDNGAGACLWWATRQLAFAVNDQGTGLSGANAGGCDPDVTFRAVEASFQTWASASLSDGTPCTDLRFTDSSTSDTDTGYVPGGPNTNLIVWRRGLCASVVPANDPCRQSGTTSSCVSKYDCWDHDDGTVIALTTTTFRADTGEILDADTEYFGWDGKSPAPATPLPGSSAASAPHGGPWFFTCIPPPDGGVGGVPTCSLYGDASCVATDVQNTMTHEAGHFLGLGHSQFSSATMFESSQIGDLAKRTLSPDDVQGICAIYPSGKSTTTCGHSASSSGSGCSTAGEADGALLLVALLALRPRASIRR